MDINIKVEVQGLEELAGAIHVFSSALAYHKKGSFVDMSNLVDEVKEESAPSKEEKESPKQEKKETKKQESKPKEEEATNKDEYIPTVVELRAKAQEKGSTAEGKKAIKALLDKFGSKSISKVEEKDRASFLSELEAL